MAVSTTFYNSAKKDLLDGTIDWGNDTIKVALVTSTYTPNYDTHDFFDDITNEISGTGYTAGGETIASITTSKDTTDDEGVADGNDVTWATATFTAAAAIVYKSTGYDNTSPLICYIDFGGDQSPSAENFTIQWSAEGIINVN